MGRPHTDVRPKLYTPTRTSDDYTLIGIRKHLTVVHIQGRMCAEPVEPNETSMAVTSIMSLASTINECIW